MLQSLDKSCVGLFVACEVYVVQAPSVAADGTALVALAGKVEAFVDMFCVVGDGVTFDGDEGCCIDAAVDDGRLALTDAA